MTIRNSEYTPKEEHVYSKMLFYLFDPFGVERAIKSLSAINV